MPNLTNDILTAAKFWVASGGTLVSAVAYFDGNRYHWVPIVAQAVTAVAVWLVPNAKTPVVPSVPGRPTVPSVPTPPTGAQLL